MDRIQPKAEGRLDEVMSKHGVSPDDVAESMKNETQPNVESDAINTNVAAKKKRINASLSFSKVNDED